MHNKHENYLLLKKEREDASIKQTWFFFTTSLVEFGTVILKYTMIVAQWI